MNTGVNRYNQQLVEKHLRFEKPLPAWHQEIVYDPQTSGGLLVAVPENQGRKLIDSLHNSEVKKASIIGHVRPLQDSIHLVFR